MSEFFGGGTTYEFEVQTAYMIQFLIGGTVPGIANSHNDSIRFQSGSLGYKTSFLPPLPQQHIINIIKHFYRQAVVLRGGDGMIEVF